MKAFKIYRTFMFIVIAVAISSISTLSAQVFHSSYYANNNQDLLSAVVVAKPNSIINYMVGTESGKLFVAEMDTSKTPKLSNLQYFSIPATITDDPNCGLIHLTGGLVHPVTNEIFVYGYGSAISKGVFAVIKMTSGLPTNLVIRYLVDNTPNTQITSACWAKHPTAPTVNTAYGIVYNGKFDRVLVASGITPQINGSKLIQDYNITSVAYDASLNNFVFGCVENYPNTSNQAIGYCSNQLNLTTAQITFRGLGIGGYYKGQSRILIKGNTSSGQDIIVVNDIQNDDPPYEQGFLIIKTNYLGGSTIHKTFMTSGFSDIHLISVAERFDTIFVLGTLINNGVMQRCILQTDYKFTSNILKTMDDVIVYSPKQDYLSDIICNPSSLDVFACGTESGTCYLVKFKNLNGNTCDTQIPITNPLFSLYGVASTLNETIPSASVNGVLVSNPSNYFLNSNLLCQFIPIKNVQQPEKKSQNANTQINNIPVIEYYNNYFVCNNFTGTCNYKIFDILGKIVQQGTTTNNTETAISRLKTGIYNILVIDDKGNSESTKIFINEQ